MKTKVQIEIKIKDLKKGNKVIENLLKQATDEEIIRINFLKEIKKNLLSYINTLKWVLNKTT